MASPYRNAGCQTDILVVGGGPAGAMAAISLARVGRRVVLVEKTRAAHHKVCGEFLSREAVHYLRQIGIDPLTLGAEGIRRVRVSTGGKIVESPLPFQALSLSRQVLDESLLVRAVAEGCIVLRGVAVESLVGGRGGWAATLSNGETLQSPAVFLATGKHDLRGFQRPPGKQSDLIGFKLHWQLTPAQIEDLRDAMDLYLFPGGYGGLSLIENDAANLCLVVRRNVLGSLGGWPALFSAILESNRHLRQLLKGGEPLWAQPLAVSPIPYGYLSTSDDGLWRIGDQAAVIPSFTGDGISIALHSAALAARMFLAGETAAAYHQTLRDQLRRSMTLATWLSRAAVTTSGRACALSAARLFPALMGSVAAATRIPSRSLISRHDDPLRPWLAPGD
jgi:flavin-dependent dehydrogenase